MIFTCTLNPSVDYQIETNEVHLGTLNRVEKTAFYPGGKGINVSRVLKNLGVDSTALGFIGGFTGAFIQNSLTAAGIVTDFVEHDEPTRINMKMKTDQAETEINGSGATISLDEQNKLIEKVKLLGENDYLILSGSLPPDISFEFYETLSSVSSKNGVSLIIDIPNRLLKNLLPYKPFLIKPNQMELSEIVGRDINTKQEAIAGAKELLQLGAQNVIISMGSEGAVFVNKAFIATAKPPLGILKSSVGAGDSVIAGFLAAYLVEKDVLTAFQYGVASGSATAFSDDLCKREEVDQLLSKIEINRLGEEEN